MFSWNCEKMGISSVLGTILQLKFSFLSSTQKFAIFVHLWLPKYWYLQNFVCFWMAPAMCRIVRKKGQNFFYWYPPRKRNGNPLGDAYERPAFFVFFGLAWCFSVLGGSAVWGVPQYRALTGVGRSWRIYQLIRRKQAERIYRIGLRAWLLRTPLLAGRAIIIVITMITVMMTKMITTMIVTMLVIFIHKENDTHKDHDSANCY